MAEERPLASLLRGLDGDLDGDARIGVRGVAYDSREVRPGDVFVAITGFRRDGLEFVPRAVEAGAVAVVSEHARLGAEVPWFRVADAREALARLACAWFDHPSHALTVLGVTGTNGKTTVTGLLQTVLERRGGAGRWSTTGVRYGNVRRDVARTTPESLELQAALAGMVDAGCAYGVVEVSSHALRLRRVAGIRFAGAAFTNLSPDHLDFHRDMDDYLDAKAELFESLSSEAPAVINFSDPAGAELARRSTGRVVAYGWPAAPDLDYTIADARPAPDGTILQLNTPRGALRLRSPLVGRANAENVAAATALALETGVDTEAVVAGVAAFAGEPGRLEPVVGAHSFRVLVDFAHTPGALEAALEAARSVADPEGRLLVVFGCGGDRDRSKRPAMGAVAARLADRVIVTSDNPRSEDPAAIVEQILAGMPATATVEVEVDRARAIRRAVAAAGDGDCVLIAGKGHEREQTFADRTVPFDDREVARAALAELAAAGGAR